LPRFRLGSRPRRAQSSTVDFGTPRSSATSQARITSARVRRRAVGRIFGSRLETQPRELVLSKRTRRGSQVA
jgi:hypothetical protein